MSKEPVFVSDDAKLDVVPVEKTAAEKAAAEKIAEEVAVASAPGVTPEGAPSVLKVGG